MARVQCPSWWMVGVCFHNGSHEYHSYGDDKPTAFEAANNIRKYHSCVRVFVWDLAGDGSEQVELA